MPETLATIAAARAEWRRREAVEAASDPAGDLAPYRAAVATWNAYRDAIERYCQQQGCTIREYAARMARRDAQRDGD